MEGPVGARTIVPALAMALQAGIGAFVHQAPVVILVAMLVWSWRRRDSSSHPVETRGAEV